LGPGLEGLQSQAFNPPREECSPSMGPPRARCVSTVCNKNNGVSTECVNQPRSRELGQESNYKVHRIICLGSLGYNQGPVNQRLGSFNWPPRVWEYCVPSKAGPQGTALHRSKSTECLFNGVQAMLGTQGGVHVRGWLGLGLVHVHPVWGLNWGECSGPALVREGSQGVKVWTVVQVPVRGVRGQGPVIQNWGRPGAWELRVCTGPLGK